LMTFMGVPVSKPGDLSTRPSIAQDLKKASKFLGYR
jgi:hypothetical protein